MLFRSSLSIFVGADRHWCGHQTADCGGSGLPHAERCYPGYGAVQRQDNQLCSAGQCLAEISVYVGVVPFCSISSSASSCLSFPYPQEIDFRNESIKLSSTAPTELKELPKRIPKDAARYHFFLYKHNHEGDYLESTGGPPLPCKGSSD